MGLPPLPAESPGGCVDPMISEFAEQFSADVTAITPEMRQAYSDVVSSQLFGVTVLIFIADFGPRIRAALQAIRPEPDEGPPQWDHDSGPGNYLLDVFVPAVARMRELDPLTSELVRLRGARQHNCRLCKSLREDTALDAGGSESLYDAIDHYEESALSHRHKAALRYVDSLIWSPAWVNTAALLEHFSENEAVELTLDVMRNACNKIAVSLGFDRPRSRGGTERYRLGDDGLPQYRNSA